MPYQKNSAIINNQKPVNIFYVWYSELCRRLNSTPAPVVKPAKPKCQTVLDFVADRLKVEEWNPVINALRHDTSLHVIAIKSKVGNCQFLHEVDTEEKLRHLKRRYCSLWTAFILKSLLKSVSCTVRNTQVLTCLEFDGLPIFAQYLEPLMKALQKNKTLKTLSLSRCKISDAGCQMVCAYVRFTPNIEVLNLSGCGLTSESGEHLAKLIKYQQINRYCESWHNSLRYSDPNVHVMRGIKRITLNGNPLIGDEGLRFILDELDDDLWMKALDMQKCGITEAISARIIDVVQYSQSLEIVDFRLNHQLSISTIEKILVLLKEKQLKREPEYQWCNTTTFTLTCESVLDSMSNYTSVQHQPVRMSKSTPFRQICSKLSIDPINIRRTKTADNVSNKRGLDEEVKKKVQQLNNQLQEEIARRRESERMNEELQQKLEAIKKTKHINVEIKAKQTVKTIIPIIDKTPSAQNTVITKTSKSDARGLLSKICNKNGFKKNGIHPPAKNGLVKNGKKNGFGANGDVACTIFEKLIGKSKHDDSSDDESLLNYVGEDSKAKESGDGGQIKNGYDMTDSQISLFKFMESLKNTPNLPVKFMNNRPNTCK